KVASALYGLAGEVDALSAMEPATASVLGPTLGTLSDLGFGVASVAMAAQQQAQQQAALQPATTGGGSAFLQIFNKAADTYLQAEQARHGAKVAEAQARIAATQKQSSFLTSLTATPAGLAATALAIAAVGYVGYRAFMK
ncbi:MAG TPA: hypothetical protein VEA38_11195, partial [Terriglobales bacterium]|nr:hypothetical protein [Terriglobales bacterium]